MRPGSWFLLPLLSGLLAAQGFHQREPNLYRQTADRTAVTALGERLARGAVTLPREGPSGRLLPLLRELGIAPASQTLVFSKTSLQRHRISLQNPRALYFGPDVYVGWVPGAPVLEIAAGDPRLGLVFYTLDQGPEEPPRLRRDDSCLSCHGGARTDDEPGLILRSVFPDDASDPIASAGETAVDVATPMAERWGGWLVTGAFTGAHRGNGFARREGADYRIDGRVAADLAAFEGVFAWRDYPVPRSDLGALLVLEQQVTVHNLLIRAGLQVRCLLHGDAAVNALLGESGVRPTTAKVADRWAQEIAAALLLAHEAPVGDPAAGADPAFAADYASRWPKDDAGRGLGVLDLRPRLFTLPLSPMVHAPAFAALPDELRLRVVERLKVALKRGRLPGGVALTKAQRDVLHHHLGATLPGY